MLVVCPHLCTSPVAPTEMRWHHELSAVVTYPRSQSTDLSPCSSSYSSLRLVSGKMITKAKDDIEGENLPPTYDSSYMPPHLKHPFHRNHVLFITLLWPTCQCVFHMMDEWAHPKSLGKEETEAIPLSSQEWEPNTQTLHQAIWALPPLDLC